MELPLFPDRACFQDATREILSMSTTSRTLFPGLDGLARNLTALISFPDLRAVDSEGGLE